MIQNTAQNTAFPGSTLLWHWCCVASSLPAGKCLLWGWSIWYNRNGWLGVKHQVNYSLGIVFISEFTTLARSWTQENFLPASSSFKGGKRQKSHDARLALYSAWGKTWIFFPFKMLSYSPCFVGTGGGHFTGWWLSAGSCISGELWAKTFLYKMTLWWHCY